MSYLPVTHSCPTMVLQQAGWGALDATVHPGTVELPGSTCRPERSGVLAWMNRRGW